MENLKKNFEEPVVQIINMCFCENIATSGGVCPKGYSSSSARQACCRCKVIYYLGDTINHSDWNKANIGEDNTYISVHLSEALRGVTSSDKLSDQVEEYGLKNSCPIGK